MKTRTNLKLYFSFLLFFQMMTWSYSSQKIAGILSYQEALFGRIYWIDGYVYWPWSWIGWQLSYGNDESWWIFERYGWNPALMVLMCSVLTVVVLIIRDQKVKSITHGSAHFATRQEIEDFGYDKCGRPLWLKLCRFWEIKKNSRRPNENNLLTGEGVFLGYLDDGTYLRDKAKPTCYAVLQRVAAKVWDI